MEFEYKLAVALVVLFIFFIRKSFCFKNLPPGPPHIPLIGHLHLFNKLEPTFITLHKLSQRYGAYMWLQFGSHPALVVSSADAARDVLKTHDLEFASRPQTCYTQAFLYDGDDVVFAPYGQHWRRMRKVCTLELFTVKRVEHFTPLRATEMKICLDNISAVSKRKEVLNVSKAVYKFTFNLTFNMIMGKSQSSTSNIEVNMDIKDPAHLFWELFTEASRAASHLHIGDCFPWLKWLDFSLPRMKKLAGRIDDFLQEQVDEHKVNFDKNDLKDFMDVLISISEDSQLSDKTIKAVAFDLLSAGLETSAISVEWTMAELVKNPEVLEKVQKELSSVVPAGEEMVSETYISRLPYMHAVIKENWRLHPPAPMLVPHLSTKDCVLEPGYQIPKGTQTFINAYAIGRDETIWKDALKFHPERMMNSGKHFELGTSFELLPFGAGRRMCPGLNLGMITVQFMVANFLYKFDWEPVEEVEDALEVNALSLKRANPLKLLPVTK